MKQKVGDKTPVWSGGQRKLFRIAGMVVRQETGDGQPVWEYVLQSLEDPEDSRAARQFRFAYWLTTPSRQNFGRNAPVLREETLLELMEEALNTGFFSDVFVQRLRVALE